MAIARWNGEIIAESDQTRIVEGNHYFPPDSIRPGFLEPSASTTRCSWKGIAGYYDLRVNGAQNPDAAWYYAEPSDEAAQIQGYVAFWKGVEVTD